MNPNTRPDDDAALSALLDDALPEEEAERLRRRISREPALAERLEELRRVDAAVRGTYGSIADEPLPQGVVDLLRPATNVQPLRRRRVPHAVTAALALAAGFAIAFFVLPRGDRFFPPGLLADGGLVRQESALHRLLQEAASGESRALGNGWSAEPRLSFVSRGGDPCRRVDLSGEDGGLAAIACRREDAWQVALMELAGGGRADSGPFYQPATGGSSPIDDAIDRLIDGAPLDRQAEQRWIERGWQ